MSLYAEFGSDPSLENDGTWVQFGTGIEVKVRRMNSQKVREAHAKFSAPHAHYERSGRKMPDDVAEEIAINTMAEGVIADWRGPGLVGKDGKQIGSDFNSKVSVLSDPNLKNFRDAIAMASNEQSLFKSASDEEAEGNS